MYLVHVLHKTYNYEVLCHRNAVKVGKCTNKYAVLKYRVVVVLVSVGFDSFPFLLPKREKRGRRVRRGQGKKLTLLLIFCSPSCVSRTYFSRFAKMKPKRLIHRLLTFLILFCVSFLCFLFVCLRLLFFFAVLFTGAVTNANAF